MTAQALLERTAKARRLLAEQQKLIAPAAKALAMMARHQRQLDGMRQALERTAKTRQAFAAHQRYLERQHVPTSDSPRDCTDAARCGERVRTTSRRMGERRPGVTLRRVTRAGPSRSDPDLGDDADGHRRAVA